MAANYDRSVGLMEYQCWVVIVWGSGQWGNDRKPN